MLLPIDLKLREAHAYTRNDELIVTTGRVERVWKLTKHGLATQSFRDVSMGQGWCGAYGGCDWQMPEGEDTGPATLVSLEADVSDDEGFTREHVRVAATFRYAEQGLEVRMEIWAYPMASGFRTQLSAKLLEGAEVAEPSGLQGGPEDGCVDRLPVVGAANRRRWFGYYNATQVRNDTHQHILKEEVVEHALMGTESCHWASAACVEDDAGGIALIKESHKCVNQSGYVGGGFFVDEQDGLQCTGWGLRYGDLKVDDFTQGWATWSVLWVGGDHEREQSIKRFDRDRFPIDPARDIYIQANTWGSTDNGRDARRAAGPESVLKELEVCSEMGIDVLQIDDGWQVPPGCETWDPGDNGWHPHPEHYPDGWGPVRERAAALGVKLGLWAAAEPVGLEELQANYEQGGFVQFKLDFAVLRRKEQIDELMNKVRRFIKQTGHKVRVNWDVTENPARYGYFFAREYGCIYLENRKPVRPLSVIYRPHTVLRDLWQLSRYLNLNRFQCSIQNVERVLPRWSDANLHSHSYATAIALMGIPLFFQETKYYSDDAKAEIRELLKIYKAHRDALYAGLVGPIGDCPDNASWTGFQCQCDDGFSDSEGYLMLFRERCNAEPQASIKLRGLKHGTITLENLVTGETHVQQLGPDQTISMTIPQAPGFAFLRYDVTA